MLCAIAAINVNRDDLLVVLGERVKTERDGNAEASVRGAAAAVGGHELPIQVHRSDLVNALETKIQSERRCEGTRAVTLSTSMGNGLGEPIAGQGPVLSVPRVVAREEATLVERLLRVGGLDDVVVGAINNSFRFLG